MFLSVVDPAKLIVYRLQSALANTSIYPVRVRRQQIVRRYCIGGGML